MQVKSKKPDPKPLAPARQQPSASIQKQKQKQKQKVQPFSLVSIKCPAVREKIQEYMRVRKLASNSNSMLDLGYMGIQGCWDFRGLDLLGLKLQSNVIADIGNLRLPSNLTYLSLGANRITSIQPLQTLHLPNLQTLKLYSNPLHRFQSLRKCQYPLLNQLNLQDIPARDVESLCAINRNWNNQVLTIVYVSDPCDRLFVGLVGKAVPKCHPTRLWIRVGFQ